MKCQVCNGGCADDSNPKVNILTRINQLGVIGIWRCEQHLHPFVCVEHNEQIEPDPEDKTKASFVHSPDCPNYCDYACNPAGFDQAEFSNPLL